MMEPDSFDRYNGYNGGRPWRRIRRDFDGQITRHVTMKLKATMVEPADRGSLKLPVAHFEGTAEPMEASPDKSPHFDIVGEVLGVLALLGLRLILDIRNVSHDGG